MNDDIRTVEDCLELLIGMREQTAFQIDSSDHTILYSIGRQVYRGIPMTDRQYELIKEKLTKYADQFNSLGHDVSLLIDSLRMPLRSIDRTRWIKLMERDGHNVIAVRFVFQKKLISQLEHIKKTLIEDFYDKEEKVHYFSFSEHAVFELISTFKEENGFVIEEDLKNYYKKLEHMKNNKNEYLPGVYGFKLRNLHEKSLNFAISSIGEPTEENLFQYYDQRERLGLFYFDQSDVNESLKNLTPLSRKIVSRKHHQVLVSPQEYTIDNLAEVVLELYRFPLLVVLNEKTCYDELTKFHKAFNGIIPNDSCSVLFRLDNADGADFNQYIREHGLNSPVDNNTKIVYINNSKLPKPLLKTEWIPLTAITTLSNYQGNTSKVGVFLDNLDLVIHYDSEISPWKRNTIEKI